MTLSTVDRKVTREESHLLAEDDVGSHPDSGCESDGDGSRRGGKPSMKEVAACFHLPIEVAAKQLGVGQTWLKLLCRSNGVARWPFRKIQSLQNSLDRSKKMQSLVEVAKVINQNLPKWLDLEGESPRVTIPPEGEPESAATKTSKQEASPPAPKPEPLRVAADVIARPKPLSLDTGAWRRPTPLQPPPLATGGAAAVSAPAEPTIAPAAGSAEEYAFRLRVLAQQQQALSAIAAELAPAAGVGPGSAALPLLTSSPASLEFSGALTATNLADFCRQRAATELATTSQAGGLAGLPTSHPMPVLPLYCEPSGFAGLRPSYGPLNSQPYLVTPGFEQLFAASAAQQAVGLEQLAKMRS